MTKEKMTMVIIVVLVAIIIVVKYISGLGHAPIDSNVARMEGPASAKVQIVEFVDFQCPACGKGYKLLRDYAVKYPNDIRVQLKYFPLYKIHAHAKQSVLYAECAARQGKFWPLIDRMFERQQQWAPMINADNAFSEMAKESGVDMKALNVCLVTEGTMEVIEQDRKLGNTLAVSSTPTYFINNKMVVGAKSLQEELNAYFPEGK